ncbi:Mg2+ and Co2+ transporter [Ferrimonas balearica]|uniref:Mg2+ and Co2+ transporter n=1 Tax=Ferrimonas balearica TaxID=44012 RepID=UPI001C950BB0|nr:Mg2+ and Co2+ transporter [Ferrimonas balearica]MBY5921203.1 Mg2+ and Co2+ transporter [Ferrimonas balearica]MBY5996112.1 Mg2+ and Co2+ transporter [Ferrimonas balearica]MBY6186770.1 Mg2+ and Co2+ transporter [Marinobacter nauticus]
MKVHSDIDLGWDQVPAVLPILDANEFMWVLIAVSVGILGYVAAKLWKLHSLPKMIAKERGISQAKLVFWMCIFGLFYKPLWIAAVLCLVTDWTAVRHWLGLPQQAEIPQPQEEA